MLSLGKKLLLFSSLLAACASASNNLARRPRAVVKRADFNTTVNDYIKEIDTAIFAISVIEANLSTAECNPFYESAFTALGYDGPFAEALICNAAQCGTNFPGYTLDQTRAGLMIAMDGLILALNNPNSPARRLDCDNLNAAFLSYLELDVRTIIDIICYPQNFTSSSTTFSGTATAPTSITLTTSSVSATTTAANSTTSASTSSSATITATNSTMTTSTTATDNSTSSTSTASITSSNTTITSSTTSSGTSGTPIDTPTTSSATTSNSTTSMTITGTETPACTFAMITASGSSMLTCMTDNPTTFHTPSGPTPYEYYW